MDDYDNSVAAGDDSTERSPETLMAAVELEHRRREIDKRVDRLRMEEHALREVQDSLAAEERDLSQRLNVAKEESDRFDKKLKSMTRRAAELEEGREEIRREIAMLDRRCRDSEDREIELCETIAAAESDLRAARAEISTIDEALETGRAALARIDGRLATSRVKR